MIKHYEKVDINNIEALFSSNKKHRISLIIPFLSRETNKSICIIGQNPSKADQHEADQTLKYLERYVFENMPQYSKLTMLNLYTRIDTNKTETSDLCDTKYLNDTQSIINKHEDFLIVFGALNNKGAYKFKQKAKELDKLLKHKSVYRLNIKNGDYAPHPGNPKIVYNNFKIGITDYDFSDIK